MGKGGDIPSYELDRRDFKHLDQNADGNASKYEICEFAKVVTPLLFPEKDQFPFIRSWDKDNDGRVNATEWQGKGSIAESKLSITRQIFMAQIDAADKDKDGLVTFEDLLEAGFATDPAPESAKASNDNRTDASESDAES